MGENRPSGRGVGKAVICRFVNGINGGPYHTSLDGRTLEDRINATGYRWNTTGENIAAGQTSPDEVVSTWLSSPGHCANIMNPAFRELGVGYAQGGSYGHYWVRDFGAAR